MSEEVLKIEDHELVKKLDQDQVVLVQKRSDVHLQDLSRLSLLTFEHPLLLPQAISWDEDSISYRFALPETTRTWEGLREAPISERLRVLRNALAFERLLDLEMTFYLSPDNIHIDQNGQTRLYYRGIKQAQPPFDMSEAIFLRQIKCLIISQFSDHAYNTLYQGGLEAVQETEFTTKVKEVPDLAALSDLLRLEQAEAAANEAEKFQTVPRTQFRIFKQLTIALGILTVLFAIPLAYFGLFRVPFQDKLLAADTAFLKVDYSEVIQLLDDVAVNRLPKTQKYELAHSYVQLLDLSYESKQNILNNISLISNDTYLDYWIYDGRGEFDRSLDLAKQLEDYQLIIYALDQAITQVRNDQTLDGAAREERLTELEAEFKKYSDMRTELLGQASEAETSQSEAKETEETTEASEADKE